MAIDVRQLRPSVLTRMLNSTPLGEVISERQLRRHRNRAGYRIGDDKHIDLLRYTAWLAWLRHDPAGAELDKHATGSAGYEALKEAARARNAELSAIGRDIGNIPGSSIRSARRGLRSIFGSSARPTSPRPSACPGQTTI